MPQYFSQMFFLVTYLLCEIFYASFTSFSKTKQQGVLCACLPACAGRSPCVCVRLQVSSCVCLREHPVPESACTRVSLCVSVPLRAHINAHVKK